MRIAPLRFSAIIAIVCQFSQTHFVWSQAASVRLEKALSRSVEGLTDIVGVAELADRSIVAVDLRERRIVQINFEQKQVKDIARSGDGPNEFTGTFTLVRWLADTVLVYGRRDFLKIAPSGKAAGKITMREQPFGNRPTGVPWFADDNGRIYFDAPEPMRSKADGTFEPLLRATVVRWDPRTQKGDTIGTLQLRDPKGPFVQFWRPFPAKDSFAVQRDGEIVFLRARDYSVDFVPAKGAAPPSAKIAFTPLRVTAADRDWYRDDIIRRPKASMTYTGPDIKSLSSADRDAARRNVGLPDEAFPAFIAPFAEERAVLLDLSHRLWVRRSTPTSGNDRPYDVLDARGKLLTRVIVPDRGRVVGFGNGFVYVVRLDDDDVEWVERHAIPRM